MPCSALPRIAAAACAAMLFAVDSPEARADAVIAWNTRAGQILADARLGTPPAIRVMAMVQTAVHDAVSQVSRPGAPGDAAAVDAAVAAASRATLVKLVPAQQAAIETAYRAALAATSDGPARQAGVAAGEQAAAALFARRADDVIGAEAYRPHAAPGVYVPTVLPAATPWPQRRPWLLDSADQYRPGPPPALTSEAWARDMEEVRMLGARASTRRTPEQTEIARFWEYSLPPIYTGVVRAVAQQPGRDPARNARLYAAVAQAMDDAMIAVFDAKYHYNFWRPTTAIRNADADGNEATVRDAAWTPLIDAPLHPEYPSAHSILAAAVGTVLQAEVGRSPMPVLETSSPTANGATRRWSSVDDFVREVAAARIYEGIHYRTSTDVGRTMGGRIGAVAVEKMLLPAP